MDPNAEKLHHFGCGQESKASLKKLMTSPTTVEYIDSLEVNDEPVWGLSQKERSLVKEARYMSQTC